MDDERLIELVRENKVLYDSSDVKYMDSKYKNNLWKKIGAQIKLDGKACKARWNNIRDNYRKSLKRTYTKSGKKTNVKLYKYHEQLNFMNKYFKERKRQESEDPLAEDLQEVEDDEVNRIQTPTSHVASTPSPIYELTSSPCVPTPSTSYISTPQATVASSSMESVLQKNQAHAERTQHPVDAFLNCIGPTLKGLNQYYLHLAKSEIFATVQKYEMKMMTEPNVMSLPGVDTARVSSQVIKNDMS